MTTATHNVVWSWLLRSGAQATSGPDRKPKRGPIFIHDAVMPSHGVTVLLEIMRADAALDDGDSSN